MVAGSLSIDDLGEQELLEGATVGKHSHVLQLRGEGRNCTAPYHCHLGVCEVCVCEVCECE